MWSSSSLKQISKLFSVAWLGLVAVPAAEAQLAVTNHGFELPALSPGGFTQVVPPGWTLVSGAAPNTGVFYPTVPSWGYVAPAGNQLLYLNSTTVEQQLAANVVEGEQYLLAVDVVRRPSFWNPAYRIDFFAGNVLLGSDLGTLVPPNGGSLVSLIGFTANAGHPAIGQPLKIRLGGPIQTNYDDVRVFVPEPELGIALSWIAPIFVLALSARLRTRPGMR